jgi:hypothetical protein
VFSSSDGGADPDDSLDSLGRLWLHIEVATAATAAAEPSFSYLAITFHGLFIGK